MAIKLSGSISRKVPIEGVQFSSQQFGGSLEVEVNSEDPQVIREKLHHLYDSLSAAIDEEIKAAQSGHTSAPPYNRLPAQSAPPQNGNGRAYGRASTNGNGNGRPTGATQAQQKCVFALVKNLNLDLAAVLADFNVGRIEELGVKDASRLIDNLKSHQNAPRQ